MESPGSSARVIQETPNSQTPDSHSDQSSVSYKDWKQSSPQTAHSPLPRGNYRCRRGALFSRCCDPTTNVGSLPCLAGAIDFSTPAQSLSAWPSASALQTPPMPSAECFNETPPQSVMPPNWQAAHEDIGSFTPTGHGAHPHQALFTDRPPVSHQLYRNLSALKHLPSLSSNLSAPCLTAIPAAPTGVQSASASVGGCNLCKCICRTRRHT